MKKNKKRLAPNIRIILKEQMPGVPAPEDADYATRLLSEKSDMIESFLRFCHNNKKAIGLASNQVEYSGERISDRFFAVRNFDDLEKWELIINPKIRSVNGEAETREEKCLTWPGKKVVAERYPSIVVSYYDINCNFIEGRIIEEFEAQVWQHEIGHLDGVEEKITSETFQRSDEKVGRNDPCPCGSGKKYKKCCA